MEENGKNSNLIETEEKQCEFHTHTHATHIINNSPNACFYSNQTHLLCLQLACYALAVCLTVRQKKDLKKINK